jgi:hypothetical protein
VIKSYNIEINLEPILDQKAPQSKLKNRPSVIPEAENDNDEETFSSHNRNSFLTGSIRLRDSNPEKVPQY